MRGNGLTAYELWIQTRELLSREGRNEAAPIVHDLYIDVAACFLHEARQQTSHPFGFLNQIHNIIGVLDEAKIDVDAGFKELGITRREIYLELSTRFLEELHSNRTRFEKKNTYAYLLHAFQKSGVETDEGFREIGTSRYAVRRHIKKAPRTKFSRAQRRMRKIAAQQAPRLTP
jgi:hypothetical protein